MYGDKSRGCTICEYFGAYRRVNYLLTFVRTDRRDQSNHKENSTFSQECQTDWSIPE